jgi:polysaccharide export outer membrane protein
MKIFLYSISLNLIFSFFLSGQTVEDLEKLKAIIMNDKKVQEESQGQLPEFSRAKSLEVFHDKIDTSSYKGESLNVENKKLSEFSASEPQIDFSQLPIFGLDIFRSAKIDFTPEIYGPVDESYPVGPGDEIVITVWGEVEVRHDLVINRQGQIFIPNVGLVNTMGMNMIQLREKLTALMSRSYSSLLNKKAFLDISLGKIRSIRIYVIGDVKNPGLFTVPALTSVFNLLFYAGGFNNTASLREISLVRKDQPITRLDFYKFLINGIEFSDIRLQNDDVILISTAKKQVYIAGAVKKAAVFELLYQEGLIDLIEYAGGLEDNAYIDQIQIERFLNNKERTLVDINYRQLVEEGNNFRLEHGDRIYVKSLDREMKNYVTIDGPIYGPRRFEYFKNMQLKDLFSRIDSIAGDAYLQRIHLTRILPDRKRQLFSLDLESILANKASDILLLPEDHIEIMSTKTLFPPDSVHIYGAVNNPGKYPLKLNLNLKDLIFAAGGFRKDAQIREAEISRIDPRQTNQNILATLMYVPLDSNYVKQRNSDDENFLLAANDNVFIRTNSNWELQRNVIIQGEVNAPGAYTLSNKMERITDLIKRSGGVKSTAYLEGSTLYRRKNNVGQIGIDFTRITKNPDDEENIYLQADDIISIPERMYTVKVIGGVNFPSSVYFEKNEGLDYYIDATGGYSELADEDNVSIRLANGKTFKPKHFLFWKYLPEDITAGSTIIIPTLDQKQKTDWSGAIRDAAAILSSVAVTLLILDRVQK